MFTGLVAELGRVVAVEPLADESVRLSVRTGIPARHGDSVCVNGVCLTVADLGPEQLSFLAMRETLLRSNLGGLATGAAVNLEPALTLSTPLGGHIVQGHVDAVGTVMSRERAENWELVDIRAPHEVARYLVVKGSVAVDGVSLTVTKVVDDPDGSCVFGVSLIPVTLAATTLGLRQPGDTVNLEADVLAKYVERVTSRG